MSGPDKRATQKSGKHMKGSRGEVAEGAVSMPKNVARAVPQGINFGTVDDQHAVMSSSPAAQPTAGEHLRGGHPTVFGSVSAESGAAHEKKIGFAGGKKHMDFQKLFQRQLQHHSTPHHLRMPPLLRRKSHQHVHHRHRMSSHLSSQR